MTAAVLDASAVLAMLFQEPGADRVEAAMRDAFLSTVNFCEVVTKLIDKGRTPDQAALETACLGLTIVPFEEAQASAAAGLRAVSKPLGLSLGDRACLALALSKGLPAFTADRTWTGLVLAIPIIAIR